MSLTAWRLVQAKQAEGAFSGEGARRYGGRWNHAGTPMVYTAGSISLAALEVLAHLEAYQVLNTYVCIPVEFDEALYRTIDLSRVPDDWAADPAPSSTRDLGTDWIRSSGSAVLAVPSVLIPLERNYLINPLHPDFGKLRIGSPQPFRFDPRVIKRS